MGVSWNGLVNAESLGNLGNLVTGGLADAPQYNPVYLTGPTQAVIQDEAANGGLTQQQIIDRELYGTDTTAPNATAGAVGQQQAALGGTADPNVAAALNNRASRLYDSQYNQLQAQAKAAAPIIQGNLTTQAVKGLQTRQDVANQINSEQMQVLANQNALRDQVVSQLFGAGGQFAGTLAAANRGSALSPQTQGDINYMNSGQMTPDYASTNVMGESGYQSDPNAPYNLTGQQSSYGAPRLGVNKSMGTGPYGYGNPGEDGNGYYGNTPPNIGYGLGVSFNGSG